jgi:hypothetical protein
MCHRQDRASRATRSLPEEAAMGDMTEDFFDPSAMQDEEEQQDLDDLDPAKHQEGRAHHRHTGLKGGHTMGNEDTRNGIDIIEAIRKAKRQNAVLLGREDFRRRFMVHICKDGTISYRDAHANEPVFNGVALPVLSVDTEEEAQAIQVRFGRCQHGEHPQMPGKPWYRICRLADGTDPAERLGGLLEIDDLAGIGQMFKRFLEQRS